jgi:hypothetical protein
LNPESKGLIKAIPLGPGTSSLKLQTRTQNRQVLDFEIMPWTQNQRVLHIGKKLNPDLSDPLKTKNRPTLVYTSLGSN